MVKIWNWIKGNIIYLWEWKFEIRKEKYYESKGLTEYYLKKWYYKKTGMQLQLDKPQTFTEKQQLIKLNSAVNSKTICSDKYRVRSYVKNIIGEEYLIPILTINGRDHFYDALEISYEQLPESFVIQCNHGAHMTHLVKGKHRISRLAYYFLQKRLNAELKINYAYCHGYEMQYRDISPCIFLTKYLQSDYDIPDYKFFFFDGEMKFFFVDQDRFGVHKRTVFDFNYKPAHYQFDMYPRIEFEIDPKICKKMIELAEKLAEPFDYVRVDMYIHNGKIYFGEMTFSSASGAKIMSPPETNLELGKLINIERYMKNEKNTYQNSK